MEFQKPVEAALLRVDAGFYDSLQSLLEDMHEFQILIATLAPVTPQSVSIAVVGFGHLNYCPVYGVIYQNIQALWNPVAAARKLAIMTAFGLAYLKSD